MSRDELNEILAKHKMWLNNEEGGERADLSGADLRDADLRRADLRWADLSGADLRRADLSGADLRRADLRWADLRRADFDFSAFPLWCGGSYFRCGEKLVYQLLAHICTLDFEDSEGIKELIMPFALKSHRAQDLGLRKGEEE